MAVPEWHSNGIEAKGLLPVDNGGEISNLWEISGVGIISVKSIKHGGTNFKPKVIKSLQRACLLEKHPKVLCKGLDLYLNDCSASGLQNKLQLSVATAVGKDTGTAQGGWETYMKRHYVSIGVHQIVGTVDGHWRGRFEDDIWNCKIWDLDWHGWAGGRCLARWRCGGTWRWSRWSSWGGCDI